MSMFHLSKLVKQEHIAESKLITSIDGACIQSHFSCVQPVATLWTVARQAPLPMGFSRQEYWSGLPCPPPGDLPNLGIEARSPTLQAESLPSEPPVPWILIREKTLVLM